MSCQVNRGPSEKGQEAGLAIVRGFPSYEQEEEEKMAGKLDLCLHFSTSLNGASDYVASTVPGPAATGLQHRHF